MPETEQLRSNVYLLQKYDPTAHPTTFLDGDELSAEINRFNAERNIREAALLKMPPLVASPAEGQTWVRLLDKRKQLAERIEGHQKLFVERLQGGEGMTRYGACMYYIDRVSSGLVAEDTLSNLERLARSRRFYTPVVRDYISSQRLDLAAGVNIRLTQNGVTIGDLEKVRQNKALIPQFFFFMLEVYRIDRDQTLREVLTFNPDWAQEYPTITMFKARELMHGIDGLITLNRELIEAMRINTDPLWQEVTAKPVNLRRELVYVANEVNKALMNPDSVEAPIIRTIVDPFLDRDDYIGFAGLIIGTMTNDGDNSRRRKKELYRRSLNLLGHPQYGSFYRKVKNQLERLVDVEGNYHWLLSERDAEMLLEMSRLGEPIPEVTFENLARTIGHTFSISGNQQDFELDVDKISWGWVVKPKTAEIAFANSPKKFEVEVVFENEIGEEKFLYLEFDTTKRIFDWNFLRAPSDPLMTNMKQAAMHIGTAALADVYRQVLEERESKKAQQPSNISTEPSSAKPKEVYTPPKKEAIKKKNPPLMTPFLAALAESAEVETGIKRELILPEGEELEIMLQNIGVVDRPRAIEKILKFNQFGLGEFKALHTNRGQNKVFELKVDEDIRVIATPSNNSERGTGRFDVFGIWYWNDAFRGKNRQRIRDL